MWRDPGRCSPVARRRGRSGRCDGRTPPFRGWPGSSAAPGGPCGERSSRSLKPPPPPRPASPASPRLASTNISGITSPPSPSTRAAAARRSSPAWSISPATRRDASGPGSSIWSRAAPVRPTRPGCVTAATRSARASRSPPWTHSTATRMRHRRPVGRRHRGARRLPRGQARHGRGR